MTNSRFEIPAGVERVCLLIRHSEAPKKGGNHNKTLTAAGATLAQDCFPFYEEVLGEVSAQFGEPSFHCSEFPRSLITAWEMFDAEVITQEPALKVHASLTDINEGAWFKEQVGAGKGEPEIIREFLGDPSLMTDGFKKYEEEYTDFITGKAGSNPNGKFVVAVCHEAGISLAAQGYLPSEQLGMDKCDAVMFFVAGGVIVGAEKVVPAYNR